MRTNEMKNRAAAILGKQISSIEKLPESGSNRKYWRVFFDNESCIATFNSDVAENRAFIALTEHFNENNLPVPEIIGVDKEEILYLQTDLGSESLYQLILDSRKNPSLESNVTEMYKKVIDNLLRFQFVQAPDIKMFFSRISFDNTSMMWDLNYFKYYFLKLAYIPFDEELLEDDFKAFSSHLAHVPSHYFMYRDFQSRNVMIKDGEPCFIDYQGGRRGALQYDLASLLYDSKADLSPEFRTEMLNYYCQRMEEEKLASSSLFRQYFDDFVLMRIMQAFGAYGYRGYYEKKSHFLQSVPFAARNLMQIIDKDEYQTKYPELHKVLNCIVDRFVDDGVKESEADKLEINICSISLKKHYPDINAEHGGGFVFDCRFLPNPGRDPKLAKLTGLDDEVIKMLSREKSVERFLRNSIEMARDAIENYMERDFRYISFAFGCTGGQHRSVYCAETFRRELQYLYGEDVNIHIQHLEIEEED
ncbi:MAG: phosphotransferase enzyme family protein [Marinilabiliales bacterium]|nr:MAG: phosphotransferase enzyme family protein [Marinilabiliales bacterium]